MTISILSNNCILTYNVFERKKNQNYLPNIFLMKEEITPPRILGRFIRVNCRNTIQNVNKICSVCFTNSLSRI